MLDILAQFDALGLGMLVGSLLFLAALIWVLVDDRSFEELNRRTTTAGTVEAGVSRSAEPTRAGAGRTPERPLRPRHVAREDDPTPGRPVRPRRAA